jgi:alpha-glucosidase
VTPAWWRSAVFYQIYPRSFADSDGDGVGDLPGIRHHIDHLRWLGVDALWLSPFYPSPMADFGYDIADHCDVDPLFGTIADYDHLLAEAHEAGMRVIIDWIPNHTSDQSTWFLDSRSARDAFRRDWYVWRDPRPDGSPPNNWRASFTGESRWVRDDENQLRPRHAVPADGAIDSTAWQWDPHTRQFYLHSFLPQQPDLDWREEQVVEAMHDVLRYWLDRGTDGFRADALACLAKPADLRDLPADLAAIPASDLHDDPVVHDILRGVRRVLEEYDGDRMMVGEVQYPDLGIVASYYGTDHDQLNLAFVLPAVYDKWRADRWRRHIDDAEQLLGAAGHTPAWVLSNHDVPRHADRFGSAARARAAAVLLLTLPGAAFLYQGEELGLLDAVVEDDQRVDPGGRDGCRAPIPWSSAPDHGWLGATPWLPFARNADGRDPASLRADPGSILNLYRRLLTARRTSPALRRGGFSWIPSPDTVLAWRRADPTTGDERAVLVNFGVDEVSVPHDGDWFVEVGTGRDGQRWEGALGGDEAVVLRPRS